MGGSGEGGIDIILPSVKSASSEVVGCGTLSKLLKRSSQVEADINWDPLGLDTLIKLLNTTLSNWGRIKVNKILLLSL